MRRNFRTNITAEWHSWEMTNEYFIKGDANCTKIQALFSVKFSFIIQIAFYFECLAHKFDKTLNRKSFFIFFLYKKICYWTHFNKYSLHQSPQFNNLHISFSIQNFKFSIQRLFSRVCHFSKLNNPHWKIYIKKKNHFDLLYANSFIQTESFFKKKKINKIKNTKTFKKVKRKNKKTINFPGPPVEVGVTMYVLSISSLSEVKMVQIRLRNF